MLRKNELPPTTSVGEIRLALQQLQIETILFVLPGLYLAGFLLIVGAGQFRDPLQAGVPSIVLFVVPIIIWMLHKSHYLAAAWVLVAGCLAAIFLVAAWGNFYEAVFLLVFPVGLAALFINSGSGALMAALGSFLLFYAPVELAPSLGLRVVTLIGMWGTVGLIWLNRRPFSTAIGWYHFTYERSRDLLEEARDSQLKLKQTLVDLKDANIQLTRLNQLAQGLRQAAEEARAAKEQFVANVSHELRTPLNMIIGFSETIIQSPDIYDEDIPPSLLADLDVIYRNSQHLSKLIDDVLDLSQVEAGQVSLTKERVSFQEIIEAAIVAVRPLYDSKGLFLETSIPADLPPIYCDPTRIRQVVLNILSNAGRFTERGGVHLNVRQQDHKLLAAIKDTGPGIAPENLGKLFEPFRQVDGSIRRRYGGTGLGLSISKRFIELHGGKIWVESEPNVGTTFFFDLPIMPVPASADNASYPVGDNVLQSVHPDWEFLQPTRPSLAPKVVVQPRFLVLEEGKSLQHLLSRYMNQVEIAGVDTASEALRALAAVPTQALLINDPSLGESLRSLVEPDQLPYGTPAIICSVSGMQEAAHELGAADYLMKPVAKETLLAALDKLALPGKTVLIIDDEPEAIRLFRRMLASSKRGYQVFTANDGQQGLRMLQEHSADVILLDLTMPHMDGFRFLAQKNQEPAWRDIPVVVVSAQDPTGQPAVSSTLAVTRNGGLSVSQLLACIDLLSRTLSVVGRAPDPAPTENRAGSPAYE